MNALAPVLTIAIPTVNRLDLFKKALASALVQTVPVDVIVSDNGSSDGTDAYLASLELPANVRRFRHAPTMAVQRHGAFLVSQLKTEWVVFLSDDDYLEPEFAARVEELIGEKPDVALVYTGCDLYFAEVAVPGFVGPGFESASDFFFEFMNGKRNISMCATAYRVSDLRAIGPQPENVLIGDMYYWTRILAKGGVVGCVGAHLSNYFFYRPGMSSETNRNTALNWARESQNLASAMADAILADPQTKRSRASVNRVCKRFLALTTSNQFAWNVLRGASRIELLRSFTQLAGLVLGDISGPIRVVAALVLPRAIMERCVLAYARRLAREAGQTR